MIVEEVVQRIRERLLTSGLLSAVEIDLQKESLVLTLLPIPQLHISERIMRLCVNFLGDYQPTKKHHYELFCWCAAFVEFPHQTCKVWIDCDGTFGDVGFDVILEFLLLGLKLSYTLPLPAPSWRNAYCLDNLVQVYRTKDEILAFYERFVTQIFLADDDLPTEECEVSLRPRWLCCLKHRHIFLQRLMVADRLHHALAPLEYDEAYEALPEIDYLAAHPSVEEMKQRLSDCLAQTFSPQEWLRARFAYALQSEDEHWARPIEHLCRREHHMNLACCQFHTVLMAFWYFYIAWLEHYNDLYRIRAYVDEHGCTPGLLSVSGIALLIHLANLDTHGISFPEWYEHIDAIDVSEFRFSNLEIRNPRSSNRYWLQSLPSQRMVKHNVLR